MADWAAVRMKTEAANLNAVRTRIAAYPKTVTESYRRRIENIAQDARQFMVEIVLTSTTATGEERARRGGEAGRVDTGKMLKALESNSAVRVRDRSKGFSVFVGWTGGKPGYTIFQEQGFRHGTGYVAGMGALLQAQEYILMRLRAMKAGYKADSTSFENRSNYQGRFE